MTRFVEQISVTNGIVTNAVAAQITPGAMNTSSPYSLIIQDKGGQVYHAAAVGFALDGTTDDTAAFNAFLSGLTSSAHLVFPAGATAKIAGAVSYTGSYDLTISGEPGATLDGTTSTSQFLLALGGAGNSTGSPLTNPTPASAALSASVNKGGLSITSTLAGVTAGSVLLVTTGPYCNATDPSGTLTYAQRLADGAWWNPNRQAYYRGEMVEVNSVTAGTPNTFTLKSALNDNYTAAKTTVYLLQTPRIVVQNLTILRNGNANCFGLWVNSARDVVVSGCKISGARERCYYLSYCYGGVFSNNYATDFYYSGSGNSDNSFGSCQNLVISNNRIFGGRQAIDLGGWEPCRHITIANNTLDNYKGLAVPVACLNTHGNAEKILVQGNYCGDGISINAINSIVRDNITAICQQNTGIRWSPSIGCDYMEFSGNYAYQLGTPVGTTYALLLSPDTTGTVTDTTVIAIYSIVVSDNAATDGIVNNGLWFGTSTDYCQLDVASLRLTGNQFHTFGTALTVGVTGGLTGNILRARNTVISGHYTGTSQRAIDYYGNADPFDTLTITNAYIQCLATGVHYPSDYVMTLTVNHRLDIDSCVFAGDEDNSGGCAPALINSPITHITRCDVRYVNNQGLQFSSSGTVWLEDLAITNSAGSMLLGSSVVVRNLDQYGHEVIGSAAVPSVAAGTGAGTSPTVSVSGSDQAGTLTVTTGTTPSASATVATVTFGNAYPGTPRSVILTPAGANAAALSGTAAVYEDSASRSASAFVLKVGSSALTGGITYTWNYQVIG